MSDMKCPFCQQELDKVYYFFSNRTFILKPAALVCMNCHRLATQEIWQELIRTRKALDVAVDALKSAHNYYEYCVQCEDNDCDTNWDCTAMNMDNDISEALEQITALEQKD